MRRAGATALVVAALALAGCGDQGPTREQYIQRADAICERGNREASQTARDFRQANPDLNPDLLQRFVRTTLIPRTRSLVAELRRLEAPEDDADELEAIYSAVERALAQLNADPNIAASGGADPFAEPNRLATAYGFQVCSRSGH